MAKIALHERDNFTTGQVATICRVAARTAGGWIDRGILKGYRIPAQQDGKIGPRRVSRKSLVAFMAANDIPMDLLELEPSPQKEAA
jgi:hypothetical protein